MRLPRIPSRVVHGCSGGMASVRLSCRGRGRGFVARAGQSAYYKVCVELYAPRAAWNIY